MKVYLRERIPSYIFTALNNSTEPRNFSALINSETFTILSPPALRFLTMIVRLILSGPPFHKNLSNILTKVFKNSSGGLGSASNR